MVRAIQLKLVNKYTPTLSNNSGYMCMRQTPPRTPLPKNGDYLAGQKVQLIFWNTNFWG